MDTAGFQKDARALGITLDSAMLERFSHFQKLLIEWNGRINLTAITDPADIVRKHFLDSLTLVPAIAPLSIAPDGPLSIIDVGSGAGFPGIPLAIAKPDWSVSLLEATGKKVEFLDMIIAELGLKNARTIAGRAETVARSPAYREQFTIAVARAVASLPILAEYALPFVKIGGLFIAQKSIAESVEPALKAIGILGGKYKKTSLIDEFNLGGRSLIIIDKIAPTPEEYPRQSGKPKKQPLQ